MSNKAILIIPRLKWVNNRRNQLYPHRDTYIESILLTEIWWTSHAETEAYDSMSGWHLIWVALYNALPFYFNAKSIPIINDSFNTSCLPDPEGSCLNSITVEVNATDLTGFELRFGWLHSLCLVSITPSLPNLKINILLRDSFSWTCKSRMITYSGLFKCKVQKHRKIAHFIFRCVQMRSVMLKFGISITDQSKC